MSDNYRGWARPLLEPQHEKCEWMRSPGGQRTHDRPEAHRNVAVAALQERTVTVFSITPTVGISERRCGQTISDQRHG